MANSRVRQHVLQQLRALSDDELIDEMFSRSNPNPGRVGCPSRDVLVELAGRVRPIGDVWYDHLGCCSPCWVDLRAIQRSMVVESSLVH
jgi:hypothetical protein